MVASDVVGVVETVRPRERGYRVLLSGYVVGFRSASSGNGCLHDAELPRFEVGVGPGEFHHDFVGGFAPSEQSESVRSVGDVGEALCGDCPRRPR